MYTVEYTERARKSLRKTDASVRVFIKAWIDKNLIACENPRLHGKGLSASHSEQWRYRVGDYRILADIQDDKLIILVIDIAHRREVYERQPARATSVAAQDIIPYAAPKEMSASPTSGRRSLFLQKL